MSEEGPGLRDEGLGSASRNPGMSPLASRDHVLRRREVYAWAMYDWANSAYSTLLITVVLHYLQEIVLPGDWGPTIFAFGIGGAMLVAAVLSPIVGAVADANCSKRRWLTGTALCGAAAAVAMALVPPNHVVLVVAAFVLMGVCFELSLVPYNGFLPEITNEKTINRVSALGYAMGYIGGSVPLVIAWMVVRHGQSIGLPGEAVQHRFGILLLGLWWGVFSLPSIWILRDRGRPTGRREPPLKAARIALRQVGRTLTHVRRYPVLALFLLAFLFYNDGVQTVITQANTLATKELHFSLDELFQLVLMIQLVALPSSLLVGWLSDRLGQKPVLLTCLTVWGGLLIASGFVENKQSFWLMGVVLAAVLGGTQAVSRAMMGVMTPPKHAAEFFGFFNLSGKAASVLGPIQFGVIYYFTQNSRLAAVSLLIFFLIGSVLVARIRVAEGHRQAIG